MTNANIDILSVTGVTCVTSLKNKDFSGNTGCYPNVTGVTDALLGEAAMNFFFGETNSQTTITTITTITHPHASMSKDRRKATGNFFFPVKNSQTTITTITTITLAADPVEISQGACSDWGVFAEFAGERSGKFEREEGYGRPRLG